MADLPPIKERDFQADVVNYLQTLGWMTWHDNASARSPMATCPNCHHRFKAFRHANAAGLPDLIAVHPKRRKLIMFELKAEKGRHSPEQLEWLAALDAVEIFDSGTWKPGDWAEIERIAR